MENKYDDFCLCSPETFEQIAKKYNEQIAKKDDSLVLQNAQSILDLANQNVCQLENLLSHELSAPKRLTLQKIYIKSCHLKKLIHSEIASLGQMEQKTQYSLYAHKNRTPLQNILGVKKICICNLCKMLKLFLASNLTNNLESVVDIITLWTDV